MKKEIRIKKAEEIERVMKKGQSKANRTFIIYKYKNSELNNQKRFAISAPKKIGNAVVRNHIKRKMRSGIQEFLGEFENNYDYFIIARPDILTLDHKTIFKQMKHGINLHKIRKNLK